MEIIFDDDLGGQRALEYEIDRLESYYRWLTILGAIMLAVGLFL